MMIFPQVSQDLVRRSQMRCLLPVMVVLVCLFIFGGRESLADDEAAASDKPRVFSGLQVGETTQPFSVLQIKNAEIQEREIVKNPSEGITLICFVHRLSNDDRILFGLGLVDFYAAKYPDLDSHFVVLSDERNKLTTMLKAWSRGSIFKKSQVSLSVDGAEGPGYYGLNRNVDMTVLVAKENKVVSNLVFDAPNNRDLETIMGAVAKALGKPKPTLAGVQQELRAERQRQLDKRIKASPVFKLAPNEELGRIMFGMVQSRGNRAANARRRNKQLVDWAGDDKERMIVLKKYCQSVLDGEFPLDQYAREALQKLAKSPKTDG